MQWIILIEENDAINAVGRSDDFEIEIICSKQRIGDTIYLEGLHFTKNAGEKLRSKELCEFGRDFLRQHGQDAKRLVIQGAIRTTGALRGKAPLPLTIYLEES